MHRFCEAGMQKRHFCLNSSIHGPCAGHAVEDVTVPSTSHERETPMPSSPAALLQLLKSDTYQQQQREREQLVAESFRKLTGSPWLESRLLYVLGILKPGNELATTYTLPTCTQTVCFLASSSAYLELTSLKRWPFFFSMMTHSPSL